MKDSYLKQAKLVVRCIPAIAAERCFAIKGGTAINLFQLNLPRLSVDIDLTYVKFDDRSTAIAEINSALSRISDRLKGLGLQVSLRGSDESKKLYCTDGEVGIKIEPNYILRGTVYPVREMYVCDEMTRLSGCEAYMNVLSFVELYGGKVCAALDRQHPRDLFDIDRFYAEHSLSEVKEGFLALALGHNRPLHELLNPIMQNEREVFEQQFTGMSDVPFTYEQHIATFERLRKDVLALFSADDKSRLLDFVSLTGNLDDFGIPHLSELPAINWKRHNLESLRKSNPAKFAEQRTRLEQLFNKE